MTCDKNPVKITKMFDEISGCYDKMNNIISLGTHYLIKKISLKNLKIGKNSYILDLCCGTGDFTKIISQIELTSRIIGLDNSTEMLKLARIKNPQKTFILGNCMNLPFGENEFDYITIGFGLRNVENREKTLSEIYRTLKHGGKFLHLDFGRHGLGSKVFDAVVMAVTHFAGSHFCRNKNYEYLIQSKNEYPEPEELIKEFEAAGLKLLKRYDFLLGTISCQILKK